MYAIIFSAALEGSDFMNAFPNVTFPSGSSNGTTRCAQITIIDDNVLESDENFTVSFTTSDTNVRVNGVTVVSIIDNYG